MTETLRRELKQWGFSETEVEVYLTVLQMGEGTASDVAEQAEVSPRHVYRVCEGLEARGLVDVEDHVQPKLLCARPPSVVEDVIERSRERMTDEIESLYGRSPERETEIEVLKRQPTVLSRAGRLAAEAEKWLILVSPAGVVESIADELADAVDRGVLVLLVTDVASLSLDRSVGDVATVVRARDSPMGFQEIGLGVDTVRSLMVSDSARIGDERRYSPALYVDDETIGVRTNDSLFGIEWRLADEHLAPDPTPLPYTCDFFRELVLQAALHRRAGTELRATVRGRPKGSDRCVTIDGAVREVRQGMVEPYNQTFVGQRSLVVETDEERVTVGGPEATIEDYAADEVRLYADDGDGS